MAVIGPAFGAQLNVGVELQQMCARLDDRDTDRATFLRQCARLVACAVGCSRVGIWVFSNNEHGRTLHCLAMYDRTRNRLTTVDDETGDQVLTYFQALEQVGYVVAADARSHFATAGFFADRLKPNGVRSLMAAGFSVNGRLFGAFTCTQVDVPIEWSRAQLNVLRQIGSRASLSLATHEQRTAMDTRPAELIS